MGFEDFSAEKSSGFLVGLGCVLRSGFSVLGAVYLLFSHDFNVAKLGYVSG